MSWNEESRERPERPRCQICRIYQSDKTPLIQAGDFVFLCSLCNSKRGTRWSFSEAWKLRYSQGYTSDSTREPQNTCYYCGNRNYLIDIFEKKHPNPLHRWRGHQECAYCKYEREVVNPRHARIMAGSPRYDTTVYSLHTFGGSGASGLNVDAALKRVKAESEARYRTVERKRAAYQEWKRRQAAAEAATEAEAATTEADDNEQVHESQPEP